MALTPGFADPVLDAQACFRAVLDALARPGRIQRLAGPAEPPAPLGRAAAAVLLTLADADTPIWTDAGPAAEAWARFHAGCPVVAAPGAAAFVFATGTPPALAALEAGTDEEPQRAATLVIEVSALTEAPGWRLSGPGIEHVHPLRVAGLPEDFVVQWAANHARFPCGIDLLLCCGDRLAALPRSTRLEVA
jgi:alpha-D-ribose 1-methylphosphonate 5-triphosphate synthase subunit PhnH